MIDFNGSSSNSIGFNFLNVYNRWHYSMKIALKEQGITHPQFQVLASLAYLTSTNVMSISQVMIANHCNKDVMSTSSIIKKLEEKKLLVKQTNDNSKQTNTIIITDQGFEKVRVSMEIVNEVDRLFFGNLNDPSAFLVELHNLILDE